MAIIDARGQKRVRKGAPRSKSGCRTCRERHVKCDEQKPECQKCVRTGRVCQQYSSPDSRDDVSSGNASVASSTPALSTPPLTVSSYSIPFRVPGSQKDRLMLHYFCVQAASDLSGHLDSDFWHRLVLENSHSEPVVRQALVALSETHLDYVTREESDFGSGRDPDINPEALKQYNIALRKLRKYLANNESPSTKTALICCALFYCLENARGECDAAMTHLQNGLDILQDWKQRTSYTGCSPIETPDYDTLTKIFVRMDVQATAFDLQHRVPVLSPSHTDLDDQFEATPLIFTNEEAAGHALDELQSRFFRLLMGNVRYRDYPLHRMPPEILAEKNRLVLQVRAWSEALDTYLALRMRLNPHASSSGALTLKVRHRVSEMLLHASMPLDENVFQRSPNPAASAILDDAAEVILGSCDDFARKGVGPAVSVRRSFSADSGIVAPLLILSMKCGDVGVRERAMTLLGMARRREGPYDSGMVLQIVEVMSKMRGYDGESRAKAGMAQGVAGSENPPEFVGREAIDRVAGGVQGWAKELDER